MKNLLSKLQKNGFYIILFLCICAIGISGYVMFNTPSEPADPEVLSDWDQALEFPIPELDSIDYDFEEESSMTSQPVEVPEPQPPKPQQPPEQKADNAPANAVAVARQTQEEPQVIAYVSAVDGEISLPYSGDELIKSKTFGDWRTHSGVDIAAEEGAKVHAVADGTVKDVYEDEMMGHTVVIEHKAGTVSTYCNLMKGVVVKKGDKVKAGDVIGGVGSSAVAECMEPPHLHLELTNNDQLIDPMSVIE